MSAFIINKSKTMESKGCKRFATTEAEIEEKRLKLNAERTLKPNKAAENVIKSRVKGRRYGV